jgi:uncharacterized membrane protein YphA (DoxX/SURF4 family)
VALTAVCLRQECSQSAVPNFRSMSLYVQSDEISHLGPYSIAPIVGFGFMEHGYAKLLKGPEAFASILHALGVPAPHLMAWLTILTELPGGLSVLLGALVPLISVPMAAVLLVAMFSVHWRYGFSSIKLLAVSRREPILDRPDTNVICFIGVFSCAGAFGFGTAFNR